MKIDAQLPLVTQVETQGRNRTEIQRAPGDARVSPPAAREQPTRQQAGQVRSSYSLQLNRQLTSIQSADSYLADLASRLDLLKLMLSRHLANSGADEQGELKASIAAVSKLLAERSHRSGGSLDGNFKISLNEPARRRFQLAGLETIEALQAAGRETLVIRAGRRQAEPAVVALQEGLFPEQILRRFNNALAPVGVRTELDASGRLIFTSREEDWRRLQLGIAVQGEGGLFEEQAFTPLQPREESLLQLDTDTPMQSSDEQRSLLDRVVKVLDRINVLREQLEQRKQEIREFLAQQSNQNDQEWAADYVQSVFGLMQKSTSSYAAAAQTVVAQANLNRFAVVNLLSSL